ncbi:MAG TPA: hypothetical protein HA359_02195 [Candidatus Poseidoniaceae archaeon]|nr:hypothetical protein [Candidatus Poseidoniaceae archaeon]
MDIAFKSNIPKQQRKAKVAKSADWLIMDKKWRSILTLALDETEIPGDDEDTNSPRNNRMMRRRGRGSSPKSAIDWLPDNDAISSDESESDAFRLAVLLINKQLKRGEWNDDLTTLENSIREKCLTNGVDTIWQTLGQKTDLLAQFVAFPTAKKKSKTNKKIDISIGRIDVFNNEELADAIDELSSLCTDASQQIAIQKVQSQLSAKRSLEVSKNLLELTGKASIISVILAISSNAESTKPLKELAKIDKELAQEFEDLTRLISGEVKDWKVSTSGEDNGLARARARFAWLNFPESVSKLPPEEIAKGLEILESIPNSQTQVQNLKWLYLSALAKSGDSKQAADLLISNTLDHSIEIEKLYDLICSLKSEEVYAWLINQMVSLDEGALQYIANHSNSSLELKNECYKQIQDIGGEAWEESSVQAVEIFAQKLEIRRLSKILTENDIAPLSHPYEALLSYHILATNSEQDLWEKFVEIRRQALTTIHSTEPPAYLSSMAQSLIMLMEGNKVDIEPFMILDRNGFKALKLARHALKQGGSGITSRTHIKHLKKSIEQSDLSTLEYNLLSVLIATLNLNQATISLQHGEADEEIFATLNQLVEGSNIPTSLVRSVRQLVFDHDIGLEQLVTWYQQNNPLSPWHTLARAALFAQNNDELNAAREYRRVAESREFDFEHSMVLYRKSIIHLAHAEQWKEAVDLLDNQPALRTAITKRFQLYLRVSFTASNQKTNEATQLLKNFVRRTKQVQEENMDGEMIEKTINFFAEDELDNLRNYPFEHSRVLPPEPFSGRVTAALNSVQRNKRRTRHGFDGRFRNEMLQNPPSIMALYDIARDSADKNPIEGLMYLERAQNSGKFSTSEMKRLYDAERSLFATHKREIPNSARRYLKNLALPPLVIVDTNILVDALVDKIAHSLELAIETSLDSFEHDNFHKVLLSRADAGRINLWLPSIVKHEIRELSKRHNKLKAKFQSSLVKPEVLDSVFEDKKITKLVDEIIAEFNRWKPIDIHLEQEAKGEEISAEIKNFLSEHVEIYEELTDMKRELGIPKKIRTQINGKKVFPELPDQEIMCNGKVLASKPLEGLGSVLIASKDSDFTVVSRAFEERFGYGIIKNSKMLNSWLS